MPAEFSNGVFTLLGGVLGLGGAWLLQERRSRHEAKRIGDQLLLVLGALLLEIHDGFHRCKEVKQGSLLQIITTDFWDATGRVVIAHLSDQRALELIQTIYRRFRTVNFLMNLGERLKAVSYADGQWATLSTDRDNLKKRLEDMGVSQPRNGQSDS